MNKMKFMDTMPGFALRVFGTFLLANILAVVLAFFLTILDDFIGTFITSFVAIGMGIFLFITLIYTTAWQKGFKELGLISRHLTDYNPARGLAAGLIATIPSLLSYIFLVLCYADILPLQDTSRWVFMLLHAYPNMLVKMLLDGLGVWGALLSAVFFIPIPMLTWMGYLWGHHNKLITKYVMYGRDKKVLEDSE